MLALLAVHPVQAETIADLNVLPVPVPAHRGDSMLARHLKQQAFAALARREAEYEALQTEEDLLEWTRRRREAFLDALGPFPPRTPLNAQVVGRREFDRFRIEKILFESQPGFHVTATLYLPLGPGPFPAVVHPTGHSADAKGHNLYQRASIYLARSGIACLCYDPIGQGERRQLFGEDGQPLTTAEHNILGLGTTLLGASLARTMIWDGMRAIDYLQERPDIDGTRIGCVGISGGGTMTSYLGAVDERVAVSAPGCYLTGFRSLLETVGPQDIEQNLFNQLGRGLDQGDYLLLRAPRPTLIMAATRDFFDIGGAWRLFREAKRAYGRWGFSERVDLVEAPTEHTYPVEHCVAGARWFARWLLGREQPVPIEEVSTLSVAELNCTPDGKVLNLPGARSLFDLNSAEEAALAPMRARLWRDPEAALREVRRLTGIRPFEQLPELEVQETGRVERPGYTITKQILKRAPDLVLPALWFQPSIGAAGPPVLYVHVAGKHVDAQPGGAIERLVASGHPVLAVDLCGWGETAPRRGRTHWYGEIVGYATKEWSLAYLLGTSFVRLRTEDLLVCARTLSRLSGVPERGIGLVAVGAAGVPALHAAALEPELFANIRIEAELVSWAATVRNPLTPGQQDNAVFGALGVYDLNDLVAAIPAARLLLPPVVK